jgi:hypothetical protein
VFAIVVALAIDALCVRDPLSVPKYDALFPPVIFALMPSAADADPADTDAMTRILLVVLCGVIVAVSPVTAAKDPAATDALKVSVFVVLTT